jgi:hypothetical protein
MSTETKNRFMGGASALAILGVTAALLTACPGTLENKSAFTTGAGGGAGCGDVETDLIGARCATVGCHSADAPAQGLNLTPGPDLAGRLVDQPSTLCMGAMLVSSTAPEMSVLYTKTLDTNSCGQQMPIGPKLSEEEEQCLLDWITELGAQ